MDDIVVLLLRHKVNPLRIGMIRYHMTDGSPCPLKAFLCYDFRTDLRQTLRSDKLRALSIEQERVAANFVRRPILTLSEGCSSGAVMIASKEIVNFTVCVLHS